MLFHYSHFKNYEKDLGGAAESVQFHDITTLVTVP